MTIRPATLDDAPRLLEIYAPYVRDTAISFEEEIPSVNDMAARITKVQEAYGYWVFEEDGQILGYAYGSQYRERHAYRFTAEVSVYVEQGQHGKGIGVQLYKHLIADLKKRGYHALIGVVTLPNPASRALHERFGFQHIGTTPQVGFKFDSWHDIGLWQLTFD